MFALQTESGAKSLQASIETYIQMEKMNRWGVTWQERVVLEKVLIF